jgi:hypothetical protein
VRTPTGRIRFDRADLEAALHGTPPRIRPQRRTP